MGRRWWATGALAGLVAVVALTGCGHPPGVDGRLTDDWPGFAEPVGLVPEVGVCHPSLLAVGYRHAYQPVDCAQSHQAETVHLGTFTGEVASLATPPVAGSPGLRSARADCEERINDMLGGPWRSGPMSVVVVLPSHPAWAGGARWYRCDVGQVRGLDSDEAVARTGSLRGGLAGSSDLRYGCFRPTLVDDEITGMRPVACTAKHRAEFVGVWNAPAGSYAAFDKADDRRDRACRKLVAQYVGVPDDATLTFRTGTIAYFPTEEEWLDGSRGVKCFLWSNDRDLTRSLKGAGPGGLPAG